MMYESVIMVRSRIGKPMKSVIILLAISMFVAGVDAVGQTEDDTPINASPDPR